MTALRSFAVAVATGLLAASAHAQAKLVPTGSEVGFVSRQMGVPVDGRFRRFDAQVDFDPARPEAAKIAITIDLGSVELGAPEIEAEVKKPEWFGAAQFPQARFQSRSVKPSGPGRFEVAGTLAIKGRSRDVIVPVTLAPAGANTVASGAFTIKRLEFGIGAGDWNDPSLVADEVQVTFKLALAGLPR